MKQMGENIDVASYKFGGLATRIDKTLCCVWTLWHTTTYKVERLVPGGTVALNQLYIGRFNYHSNSTTTKSNINIYNNNNA